VTNFGLLPNDSGEINFGAEGLVYYFPEDKVEDRVRISLYRIHPEQYKKSYKEAERCGIGYVVLKDNVTRGIISCDLFSANKQAKVGVVDLEVVNHISKSSHSLASPNEYEYEYDGVETKIKLALDLGLEVNQPPEVKSRRSLDSSALISDQSEYCISPSRYSGHSGYKSIAFTDTDDEAKSSSSRSNSRKSLDDLKESLKGGSFEIDDEILAESLKGRNSLENLVEDFFDEGGVDLPAEIIRKAKQRSVSSGLRNGNDIHSQSLSSLHSNVSGPGSKNLLRTQSKEAEGISVQKNSKVNRINSLNSVRSFGSQNTNSDSNSKPRVLLSAPSSERFVSELDSGRLLIDLKDLKAPLDYNKDAFTSGPRSSCLSTDTIDSALTSPLLSKERNTLSSSHSSQELFSSSSSEPNSSQFITTPAPTEDSDSRFTQKTADCSQRNTLSSSQMSSSLQRPRNNYQMGYSSSAFESKSPMISKDIEIGEENTTL